MSAETINIRAKFGQAVKIKDHVVRVNHVAAKQKYVIGPKDGANQPDSFPDTYGIKHKAVSDNGFQKGEFVIHERDRSTIIHINTSDTLETIIDSINDTGIVKAFIVQNLSGTRIIVESMYTGIDNTFYLTGNAIRNLSVEVPRDAIKFMDIYNNSGNAFGSYDRMWSKEERDSFQPGMLRIGTGSVELTDGDVISVNWMKQCINQSSYVTNVEAKIVLLGDPSCVLRLATKMGNNCLGYTNTYNSVFRGIENTQIKYSSAQNTDIMIDDIPFSFSGEEISSNFIGRWNIEALGDDVIISEI